MLIAIKEADALTRAALERIGYTPDEAVIIADHVMGCELRGVSFGGLSRALSLIDRQRLSPRRPTLVTRETPISALIDGFSPSFIGFATHASPLPVKAEAGISKLL